MFWLIVWNSIQLITICMVILWIFSIFANNVSMIDVFWGIGFVLINYVGNSILFGIDADRLIWGTRLSCYLLWRNWGKEEDFRYRALRKSWGENFWLTSFFIVEMVQAILMLLVSTPLINIQANSNDQTLSIFDICGLTLCVVGFFFETVGDLQLSLFIVNPDNRGKVLTSGLWKFTRHPNYFGDACFWWGIFVINLSVPYGILFVLSPIVMNYLLLRISGASLLERSLRKTKSGYLLASSMSLDY